MFCCWSTIIASALSDNRMQHFRFIFTMFSILQKRSHYDQVTATDLTRTRRHIDYSSRSLPLGYPAERLAQHTTGSPLMRPSSRYYARFCISRCKRPSHTTATPAGPYLFYLLLEPTPFLSDLSSSLAQHSHMPALAHSAPRLAQPPRRLSTLCRLNIPTTFALDQQAVRSLRLRCYSLHHKHTKKPSQWTYTSRLFHPFYNRSGPSLQ